MNSRDPKWLSPATYPMQCRITARVSDMDGYGHLNAIRIGTYYEDARATFYGQAFPGRSVPRFLVAELTIRYLDEGFWPGELQVRTGISKIGNSSFQMMQGLFQDDRCLGLCQTVLVHTDGGKSGKMPDDARSTLEGFRVRTEPAAAQSVAATVV